VGGERPRSPTPSSSPRDSEGKPRPGAGRYRGVPPVVIVDAEGLPRMAPFLMDDADLTDCIRLHTVKFPRDTLNRYRLKGGLRRVRVVGASTSAWTTPCGFSTPSGTGNSEVPTRHLGTLANERVGGSASLGLNQIKRRMQ